MRYVLLTIAAAFVAAGPESAAPCKDAERRFATGPKPAAGAIRCKDAGGRYAKCGMPGTRAVVT